MVKKLCITFAVCIGLSLVTDLVTNSIKRMFVLYDDKIKALEKIK